MDSCFVIPLSCGYDELHHIGGGSFFFVQTLMEFEIQILTSTIDHRVKLAHIHNGPECQPG